MSEVGDAALPQIVPTEIAPEEWEAARQSLSETTNLATPIDKAAVILTAIGPELAGEFLKDLNETALTRTAMAISRLDRVPDEELDAIIAEFLLSIGTDEEILGGSQTARRLLSQVLDDNAIEKIMFDVEGGDSRAAWKKLNDCTPAQLSAFIGAEHPQTAAVILSELRPDKAARVIERLDTEFAQLSVFRLSRVPALDNEVSEMIERVITRDFLSAIQRTKRSRKPSDVIAGLMNNLTSDTREKFLEQLEEQNSALAAEVVRTMFTFADIRMRVEPREVSVLVKEIEEPMLLQALRFAQQTKNASGDFILENISKRLAERLGEEIESMQEVSPRDGEAAHQDVVRQIQELAKSGKISLIEDEVLD